MAADLTRLQVVTKAADAMGRSLTGTTRSSATLQSVLEEMYEWAQLRLARAYKFPEMDVRDTTTADTVADTMIYSYSTLFGATARINDILSIVLEDGTSSRKLTRKLYSEFIQRWPYPEGESTGKSTVYTRVGNNLWFFKVPNNAYDIHSVYSKMPTRATADGDYSEYEYKDDLLIAGTVVEFFSYMQEFTDAAKWNSIWKSKLKETLKPRIAPADWEPEGRAFNSTVLSPGDFWSDPLIINNP